MELHPRRRTGRLRLLGIIAVLPFVASCAGSASVSGLVVPRGAARLDQAVIYVMPEAPTSGRAVSDWADHASLTFERGSLKPAVSVAMVGSWLEIWNADSVYHQPFSRSPALSFPARTVRPGTGSAMRLTAKGMIQVFCQLHEGESAEVLVLENGAWTRPNASGAFRFPPLPRGRYVIHVWHPRLGEQTTPLDIERPGPMTVELHY